MVITSLLLFKLFASSVIVMFSTLGILLGYAAFGKTLEGYFSILVLVLLGISSVSIPIIGMLALWL